MIVALQPVAARRLATAPAPESRGVATAAAPQPRALVVGFASSRGLAQAAAPLALLLVTIFTTADRPGWSLDFSRPENSGLTAAL